MLRLAVLILVLAAVLLSACSTVEPVWRNKASQLLEELGRQEVPRIFPGEFGNLLETFEHGEAVLHVHKDLAEADSFYLLALQKGEVLKTELKLYQERQKQEEAQKAARAEEQRLMAEAAAAEARLAEQARIRLEKEARAAQAAKAAALAAEPAVSLPQYYTVRRGETLPQIAARNEIYNDASLWPLIYRANRDQIRDPRQLWPGQRLKIPRHFSRDEASEAKRYSGRR